MTELQMALIEEARQLRFEAAGLREIEHQLHDRAKELSERAWDLIDEATLKG